MDYDQEFDDGIYDDYPDDPDDPPLDEGDDDYEEYDPMYDDIPYREPRFAGLLFAYRRIVVAIERPFRRLRYWRKCDACGKRGYRKLQFWDGSWECEDCHIPF